MRPYGKSHGVFASMVENQTVRHSRAKSGGVLGDCRTPDSGSSCALADHQSSGKGELHRRLRSRRPVCAEPAGFRYGLAKSRMENPQVMGQAGETHGSCRCDPPLPDELLRRAVGAPQIARTEGVSKRSGHETGQAKLPQGLQEGDRSRPPAGRS